jgi:hypothetical protein
MVDPLGSFAMRDLLASCGRNHLIRDGNARFANFSALGSFIMEPYRPAVTARQGAAPSERGGIRYCPFLIPL